MSIIDHALKKTQASLEKKDQRDPDEVKQRLEQADAILTEYQNRRRLRLHWGLLMLMAVLLLLLVLQFLHPKWSQHRHYTVPPVAKHAVLPPLSSLHLTGVMSDSNHRIALINQKPVAVGDRIAGYRVVSIEDNAVEVSDGSKQYRVVMS